MICPVYLLTTLVVSNYKFICFIYLSMLCYESNVIKYIL